MAPTELKLGVIGCQTSHGGVYTELFNAATAAGDSIAGGRVTHVCDYARER